MDIIHASHKYGRLKITTCWDLQGFQHLHLLLGHIQLNDLLGQHLLTLIDYTYLHLGIQDAVFTYDYDRVKNYILHSWISNTWNYFLFLSRMIILPSLRLHPQGEHDIALMDLVNSKLSGIKLKRVNAV